LNEMIKRRKDEGFTLIELMIVIAVIGILAVVLVPRVGSIKTAAKSAGIDTNSRLVQAYVQSRISAWASDPTTFDQGAIAADIKAGLTSADQAKNPFTGGTDIKDKINSDTLAVTDAIQIIDATDTPTGEGAIAVLIPTSPSATSSIIIQGLNQSATVYSSVTLTP